jgi:four helix bundle protein
LQGCRVTGLQGYRVTGSQGCRVAGLQGYRVTGSQGHRVTGLQGCRGRRLRIVENFYAFRYYLFENSGLSNKTEMKTHKELNVWKDSIALVVEIYEITKHFPREETYGLTSQLRRAAVSVPANTSEGAARHYTREFIRFLRIAQASLSEVETLLHISLRLNYLDESVFKSIQGKIFKVNAQLSGLIKSLTPSTM